MTPPSVMDSDAPRSMESVKPSGNSCISPRTSSPGSLGRAGRTIRRDTPPPIVTPFVVSTPSRMSVTTDPAAPPNSPPIGPSPTPTSAASRLSPAENEGARPSRRSRASMAALRKPTVSGGGANDTGDAVATP
jgi:hypothetical protein